MMKEKSVTTREKIFVIILALITFFACNSDLPTDIMESRNIVTAREIAEEGNWLVPTMNGELRLEKPPLPTWVGAVIEKVCPHCLSAQRIAPGIMGLMWTVFMYFFAKLLTKRRDYALLTVTVFLTSYHIVVMGRTATWDIYCHAFMMGGIYFLARGLDKQCWLWFPLAGLMMGLSFMSKGPVAFYALLLPALVAIIAFMHPTMKGKWKAFIVMIIICVVVSDWWYAYLYIYQHDAVEFVINKESGAWSNHNVRPWYYYWRFFTETGIWTVLMFAALFFSYWKKQFSVNTQPPSPNTYLFSLTWTLSALVLLSLMPEKKIRYLLPMMAPCALCVACLLLHFETAKDKASIILMRINGSVVTAIAIALPVMAIVLQWRSLPIRILICVLFLADAVYIALATYNLRSRNIVYGVCMMFMVTELFLLKPIGGMFGNKDRHSISLTQEMPQLKTTPFYHAVNDSMRIELVYEAGKKILPINTSDSAAVMKALPFALVSHEYASQMLPANILQNVDTVSFGTFDDNKHPKNGHHYSQTFITHLTLINAKQP